MDTTEGNSMVNLVTGGAGFIGSALAARLLKKGEDVIVVDSLTDYYDVALKEKRLEVLQGMGAEVQVRDIADISNSDLDGVKFLYHLAGQPGVRPSWGSEFAGYVRNNVAATQSLLEAAAGSSSLERFVYSSSSSVYGNARRYPTTEEDLPTPMSPYGVTKLAAEHLCSLYFRNFDVPTVSLRYFTVYGPGQRPDMAFHKFIKAALGGKAIPVYGDGSQIRDFTYVDDIVEANLAVAVPGDCIGQVYNVCGGSSVTVNETIELISNAIGGEVKRDVHPGVPGDVHRTGGTSRKLMTDTQWSPSVSIAEGIAREVAWIRSFYG